MRLRTTEVVTTISNSPGYCKEEDKLVGVNIPAEAEDELCPSCGQMSLMSFRNAVEARKIEYGE
jgi:hypothetical protein